jgi:hypothetical protein
MFAKRLVRTPPAALLYQAARGGALRTGTRTLGRCRDYATSAKDDYVVEIADAKHFETAVMAASDTKPIIVDCYAEYVICATSPNDRPFTILFLFLILNESKLTTTTTQLVQTLSATGATAGRSRCEQARERDACEGECGYERRGGTAVDGDLHSSWCVLASPFECPVLIPALFSLNRHISVCLLQTGGGEQICWREIY